MSYSRHIHVCFSCSNNDPVAKVAKRHLTPELKEKCREAAWFLEDLSKRTGSNPGPQGGLSLWGMVGNYTDVGGFVELLRPFWRDLYRDNVLNCSDQILVFEEGEEDHRTSAHEISCDCFTDSLSVAKRECPFAFGRDYRASDTAVAERLWAVLEGVTIRYPAMPLETVKDLVTDGELRVAAEILCDDLAQENRTIEPTLHDKLVSVCEFLGLDASYWGDLRDGG